MDHRDEVAGSIATDVEKWNASMSSDPISRRQPGPTLWEQARDAALRDASPEAVEAAMVPVKRGQRMLWDNLREAAVSASVHMSSSSASAGGPERANTMVADVILNASFVPLVLDMPFNEAGKEGSGARKRFVMGVRQSIAKSLGIDEKQIEIGNVAKGSTHIQVHIQASSESDDEGATLGQLYCHV